MRSRLKTFSLLLSSVIVFLSAFCGCDKNDNLIDSLEKVDISYLIKTSLPCVNGEKLYYKTPLYVPSDILIKYQNPICFDGKRLFFTRFSITEAETNAEKAETGSSLAPRTAVISYYDIEKNEIVILLEEDNKSHINYKFAAYKDSCLYYYRTESVSAAEGPYKTQLFRLNIDSKEPVQLNIDFSDYSLPKNQGCAIGGDYLFFEYSRAEDEKTSYITYRYNTQSGKAEEFQKDIHNLMQYGEYGDGIAYLKDNKLMYFNIKDNTESELYTIDDNENISFYSKGNKVFYFLGDYEKNSWELGYLDNSGNSDNLKKYKLCENPSNQSRVCKIADGDELLMLNVGSKENLIYDSLHKCFVRINLNREENMGLSADNSVIFICYDRGGNNPILYLYSREKVKTQLPPANKGQLENGLDNYSIRK